jgi:phosphomannomutase
MQALDIIANRAMELEKERDLSFVFGYEEALGYTVGTLVRDKDGVSAAVAVADLAEACRARGGSLLSERDAMWRRHGLYVSRQVSLVLKGAEGAQRMATMMNDVRRAPPSAVAGLEVIAVQDFLSGTRTPTTGPATTLAFPASNVIALEIAGGHRIMLRPSGTEPKIKFYFDVRATVGPNESIESARDRATRTADDLALALGPR